MPIDLTTLAQELGTSQRTLRRAGDIGLIHGQRTSPRRFRISFREASYLRRQWPLLSALRAALRTEPNVRLAVLYGSAARGDLHPRSDIDVAVSLRDDSVSRLADLSRRLGDAVDRPVQPVRLKDLEPNSLLQSDVMRDARVLVDRDEEWQHRLVGHESAVATDGPSRFDYPLEQVAPLAPWRR